MSCSADSDWLGMSGIPKMRFERRLWSSKSTSLLCWDWSVPWIVFIVAYKVSIDPVWAFKCLALISMLFKHEAKLLIANSVYSRRVFIPTSSVRISACPCKMLSNISLAPGSGFSSTSHRATFYKQKDTHMQNSDRFLSIFVSLNYWKSQQQPLDCHMPSVSLTTVML